MTLRRGDTRTSVTEKGEVKLAEEVSILKLSVWSQTTAEIGPTGLKWRPGIEREDWNWRRS